MISSRIAMTDDYQTTINNRSNYIDTNNLKLHLLITQHVQVSTTLRWTFQLMDVYFSTVDSFEASFNLLAL